MVLLFNTPPGWPVPPTDWWPTPDWRPPAAWPPPPRGWVFWINHPDGARTNGVNSPATGGTRRVGRSAALGRQIMDKTRRTARQLATNEWVRASAKSTGEFLTDERTKELLRSGTEAGIALAGSALAEHGRRSGNPITALAGALAEHLQSRSEDPLLQSHQEVDEEVELLPWCDVAELRPQALDQFSTTNVDEEGHV